MAPYQVILDEDHTLIYVPDDDDRCCREASEGEIRITKRMDALAPLPSGAPVDTDDMLNQEETLGCRRRQRPTRESKLPNRRLLLLRLMPP